MQRLVSLFLINTKLSITEMLSNKTRSVISSFGVFLGVASLLVLLSFIRAMNKEVSQRIVQMGGLDILEIKQLSAETPEEEMEFRRSPGLLMQQLEQLQEEIPEISMILPQVSIGHVEPSWAGKKGHAHPEAVGVHHLEAFNYEISDGRALSPDDFERSARVCIVGKGVVDRTFPPDVNPIGQKLTFMNLTFEIVGIIQSEGMRDQRARALLLPYDTWVKYIGGVNAPLAQVSLKISDMQKINKISNTIIERLTELHRGVRDVDVVMNVERIKEMKTTNNALNILLAILALLSIFTGGVSIMNIMFAVIGDRIREIGLRKALGARKSDLFVQFVVESIFLCCVGAVPGMLAGSIPAWLPSELFPMEPYLLVSDYILALGFTTGIGFFAGLFPALKAANMRPIEALQYV
ncbi:MAG: ABC transporter permease [Fibrobacteria bacterium]|nr:ABC transporter permease [Fibrobacteria bacterium]